MITQMIVTSGKSIGAYSFDANSGWTEPIAILSPRYAWTSSSSEKPRLRPIGSGCTYSRVPPKNLVLPFALNVRLAEDCRVGRLSKDRDGSGLEAANSPARRVRRGHE
jgi:hypothetical protein